MSGLLRISMRLLGLLMFLAGGALLVALIRPGPAEIADWMGRNCSRGKNIRHEDACRIGDVLELALMAPGAMFIGLILLVALRPPGKGPITLDFSRSAR